MHPTFKKALRSGAHDRMFSVLISYRLSGREGLRSPGCNVSVWPETIWERDSIHRTFTAMALNHKPLGQLPRAPEPAGWQRLSPAEHLCVGQGGPRMSFCHWWRQEHQGNRGTDCPPQTYHFKKEQNNRGQPLGNSVFLNISFHSSWWLKTSAYLSPTRRHISPLSKAFHGIWTGKSGLCQFIKRMWSTLNLANGKIRQSDHLNVLYTLYI